MKETNKKLEEYLNFYLNTRINRNQELYKKIYINNDSKEDEEKISHPFLKKIKELTLKNEEPPQLFNKIKKLTIFDSENINEDFDEDIELPPFLKERNEPRNFYDYEKTNKIDSFINKTLDEDDFKSLLFKYIDDTGLKDSDIYKKAFIDRRLFNKIKNEDTYHPSKNTVISLGLALNLNIKNFEKLLNSASYTLPKNNYFDLIIRFCVEEKIYNIMEVNTYLYQYNCNTLN